MRIHLILTLLLSVASNAAELPTKSPTTPVSARTGAPIPSAQSIAEMVPARGKLGERELTLMAIAQRPDLEGLRGAVSTATAKKRAAHDLENPEVRNSYAQDNDDKGVLLRLHLPSPWERKARIQRAAAEINLAEAEYYAREDEVVRTVRGAYQELAILQGKLAAQSRRKAGFVSYRDWLEERKMPKLGLDLASARAKVYDTLSDIRALENDTAAMREVLAAYCGLTDASRIDTSIKARRISNPGSLDVEYLTSIAMLYRSDVLGDQARLAVASADLSEIKARRIPFVSFIDTGYSHNSKLPSSTGRNEEWVARVGISLPIWEWVGLNKQHEVHIAASQSLERKIEMQRKIISTEVSQAVKCLASAEAQLSSYDKDLADLKSDMKKSMADAQMATVDADDLIKGARIEHEFKDLAQQMEVSRYSAFSAYHKALMSLEKALGIRLERALSPGAGP